MFACSGNYTTRTQYTIVKEIVEIVGPKKNLQGSARISASICITISCYQLIKMSGSHKSIVILRRLTRFGSSLSAILIAVSARRTTQAPASWISNSFITCCNKIKTAIVYHTMDLGAERKSFILLSIFFSMCNSE